MAVRELTFTAKRTAISNPFAPVRRLIHVIPTRSPCWDVANQFGLLLLV